MEFADFELLWIQSTPSIAAIFFQKYLTQSHALYCPDDNVPTIQTTRTIARSILAVINSNDKKVAVHFTKPCSELRRKDIYNFILKSMPSLSSYCLSIPTTTLQAELLLGWSSALDDALWKRRCGVGYDPEACVGFTPPSSKTGQSDWAEFTRPFVVSDAIFIKKALIVDLRKQDMVSFDPDNGVVFTDFVKNAIQGWIRASIDKPRTLVWILDERTLYSDSIKVATHDKRENILKKYRSNLTTSLQNFNSHIPIYCYVINYYYDKVSNLSHHLAHLQHRHNICLSQSILLTWSNKVGEELTPKSYFSSMKRIYLTKSAEYNKSKWKSIYSSYFNEIEENTLDKLNYISPETLYVATSTETYKIPFLKAENNQGSLTMSEEIKVDITHGVSAQSFEVLDKWTNTVMQMQDQKADFSARHSMEDALKEEKEVHEPLTAIDLSLEKVKEYITDERYYEHGEAIMDTLVNGRVNTAKNKKSILVTIDASEASSLPFSVSFTIMKSSRIGCFVSKSHCSCPIGAQGKCKHCAAALIRFSQHPEKFEPSELFSETSRNHTISQSDSSSTSSSKKRISEPLEGDSTSASGSYNDSDENSHKKLKILNSKDIENSLRLHETSVKGRMSRQASTQQYFGDESSSYSSTHVTSSSSHSTISISSLPSSFAHPSSSSSSGNNQRSSPSLPSSSTLSFPTILSSSEHHTSSGSNSGGSVTAHYTATTTLAGITEETIEQADEQGENKAYFNSYDAEAESLAQTEPYRRASNNTGTISTRNSTQQQLESNNSSLVDKQSRGVHEGTGGKASVYGGSLTLSYNENVDGLERDKKGNSFDDTFNTNDLTQPYNSDDSHSDTLSEERDNTVSRHEPEQNNLAQTVPRSNSFENTDDPTTRDEYNAPFEIEIVEANTKLKPIWSDDDESITNGKDKEEDDDEEVGSMGTLPYHDDDDDTASHDTLPYIEEEEEDFSTKDNGDGDENEGHGENEEPLSSPVPQSGSLMTSALYLDQTKENNNTQLGEESKRIVIDIDDDGEDGDNDNILFSGGLYDTSDSDDALASSNSSKSELIDLFFGPSQ